VLEKLKNLFVELDEVPKTPDPMANKDGKIHAEAPKAPVAVVFPVTPTLLGQADPEIAQILEKAITDSNLKGFDYFEFREVLVKMAGIPMTEEQKFQAAFAAAQSMGVDKATLTKAIDHYIGILDGKKVEFQTYVESVIASEVTSKEQAIEASNQEIQKEVGEIERLTKSIQERRRQQDETSVAIAQARVTIQNKGASFEATYLAIVGSLQSDRTKIETYLK